MGYYLDMKVKNEDLSFVCLGGKFFGYLDDDEYSQCSSAKFIAACCGQEDYDFLNVAWSCESFELNSYAAEIFLNLYVADLEKFKEHAYVDTLYEAIRYVTSHDYQIYEFSMG